MKYVITKDYSNAPRADLITVESEGSGFVWLTLLPGEEGSIGLSLSQEQVAELGCALAQASREALRCASRA